MPQALGMENGTITDRQISASSENSSDHAAFQGRLSFQATSVKSGSWSPSTAVDQWLQIDLANQYTKVTRVATQGRNAGNCNCNQWVTKYNLQYSYHGVTFQYYREQGQVINKVGYKLSLAYLEQSTFSSFNLIAV